MFEIIDELKANLTEEEFSEKYGTDQAAELRLLMASLKEKEK